MCIVGIPKYSDVEHESACDSVMLYEFRYDSYLVFRESCPERDSLGVDFSIVFLR